tara:strand:+ start:559 stop:666 length:108 start_codon:yes stop_codon:yes gene_type:complete
MENFTEFSHMLDGTDIGFVSGIIGTAIVLLLTEIW